MSVVAVILACDPCPALGALTAWRCKGALPFGGRNRTIDFALSNCVNSGIEKVGVLTQYRPRELNIHLAHGRPWGRERKCRLTGWSSPTCGRIVGFSTPNAWTFRVCWWIKSIQTQVHGSLRCYERMAILCQPSI